MASFCLISALLFVEFVVCGGYLEAWAFPGMIEAHALFSLDELRYAGILS